MNEVPYQNPDLHHGGPSRMLAPRSSTPPEPQTGHLSDHYAVDRVAARGGSHLSAAGAQ